MKFVAQKNVEQAEQDAETVRRMQSVLDTYWATAGPGAMVAVSHMRDLLDPRGLWTLDPERRRQMTATQQGPAEEADPSLDPLTGCKPVTPPGA
jgi:hypothetical protein